MKKRWFLGMMAGVTAVCIAVILPSLDQPVSVSAITLEPQRVEQTVSCTGVVETASSTSVTVPISCLVAQVCVEEGDRVAKGDVLAIVDKEATRRALTDANALMLLAAMPEEIVAPGDGTVLQMRAVAGQTLEMGTPCAVVALDKDMQIRIAIRERDLRTLKQGMSVRVTGDGFAQNGYEGVLSSIASTANANTTSGTVVEGVVKLKEGVYDPSLRIGLTAKASVITAVTDDGLIVPYEAVQTDQNGSYVYVMENGQAMRQKIEIAAQVAEGVLLRDGTMHRAQIISDVSSIAEEGQRVVVRGDDS